MLKTLRKLVSAIFIISNAGIISAQNEVYSGLNQFEAEEVDNSFFRNDKFWRGADGAATIDLENGKVLWLFSDTFIDTAGTGLRSNSIMINNSLAIQDGNELGKSKLSFFWKRTNNQPKSFFELPGKTWFWTGHGIVLNGKLVIFLFEEKSTTEGLGFETVGWTVAIIDNPNDDPASWDIKYVKGPETFGVIVGSSAVLKDSGYVYAFGVKEPGTHETYLLRFENDKLENGDLSGMEWWVDNAWTTNVYMEPKQAALFSGQTEFSVHYDKETGKFIQIQTYGFGVSSVGYRFADQLQGPWCEPVIFFTPDLNHEKEFNYTANAHPELESKELLITYNINNFDFSRLVNDESIYFPRIVKLKINQFKHQ
ncbi:MAG TPA: DUF4185 domain-containing protein [Draconibacterium sp.]|nr:DUF4185 domain-containing protein [Draconibacterium sp.]